MSLLPANSPFEELLSSPAWAKPLEEIIYAPAYFLAETLSRPLDQCIYMIASIVALCACFALKSHPGSAF